MASWNSALYGATLAHDPRQSTKLQGLMGRLEWGQTPFPSILQKAKHALAQPFKRHERRF